MTQPSTGIENKKLATIRALLAKAESTTFPEEAEAYLAKATELMARYGIDAALAGMQAAAAAAGGPTAEKLFVPVPNPFGEAKCRILTQIAEAHGCEGLLNTTRPGRGKKIVIDGVWVFGSAADIETVQILFTSVLLQIATAIGRRTNADNPRLYRRAYIFGFGNRVAERIREQRSRYTAEATAVTPGTDLVLASQADANKRAMREQFPNITTVRTSITQSSSTRAGRQHGREDGSRADLGGRRFSGNSRPRELA